MERNLRALGLGAIVRAFGLSLLGPFFALYLHNVLHLGYVAIGLLFVAVGIVPLFVGTLGGFLADRVGRRRLLLLAIAVEAASLFALALAIDVGSLVGVIVAFGTSAVASTAAGPALAAYIADLAVGSERTQAFTWFRVTHNIGFTLGVLAGGALVQFLGFLGVALTAGLFASAGVLYLGVTLEASPYDRRRAAGATPTPGGPAVGPGSIRTSVRLLAADRTFLILCLAFALANLSIAQWSVTFPLFVQGRMGISYAILGTGLALNGLIVVFGQTPMTHQVLGRRHTSIAIGATGFYAAGFLLLGAAADLAFVPLAAFFAAVTLMTIGENLISVPQSTLPSNIAPLAEIGAYNGAFATITGVGPLLAIVLGGVALATLANPLALWAVLMLPALPAALLLRWVGRHASRDANRA